MKPHYKPVDRPEWEETWFCHFVPPRKQVQLSALTKPLSQVPDLNKGRKPSSAVGTEDRNTYIRGKVNPNDSKYIRLAKAGGRKDLLTFRETTPFKTSKATEPVSCPVAQWYYDNYPGNDGTAVKHSRMVNYPQRPEWMTYIEYAPASNQNKPAYIPNRGIIAWDKMSAWKREEFEKTMQQKTKNMYAKKRKEERNDHKKKTHGFSKVNSRGLTEGTRIRLPKIDSKNLPRVRKLSGADLKVRWYEKWYIMNMA